MDKFELGGVVKLNDLLHFDASEYDNIVVRFNIPKKDVNYDPINLFLTDRDELIKGNLWNYSNYNRVFSKGNIVLGFARLKYNKDHWLLFDIAEIVEVLAGVKVGPGYVSKTLDKYGGFLGRLVVSYHSNASYPRELVQKAVNVLDGINVVQLLTEPYSVGDEFPGYNNVNISWYELSKVIDKEAWRVALGNQKGIYLITDTSNGKLYVGKASGNKMLLGRWQAYVENGHGGNADFKKLGFDHIKKYFRYSILEEITDDAVILQREHWWMDVLKSRDFGYNNN